MSSCKWMWSEPLHFVHEIKVGDSVVQLPHPTKHQSEWDSKVHGANMGPIWGRQDPGGPYIGPMNFAIWVSSSDILPKTVSLQMIIICANTWPYKYKYMNFMVFKQLKSKVTLWKLNVISMEADNPSPDVSWLSLILSLILDWTIELMVASSNNARLDTEQHRTQGTISGWASDKD